MPPLAKSLNTRVPCAQCKQMKNIMIGMEPGPDGKAWWLCFGCWRQGLKGKKDEDVQDVRR